MLKILVLTLGSFLFLTVVQAQEKLTGRTFTLTPGAKSPNATLADIKWLRGHWTGNALGGTAEEIWSSGEAGSMVGVFRLIRDGKPVFYELLTIAEADGSLVLKLKHFNPDLTGWEDKNTTIDFPLVALSDGAVHFDGMSFHPGEDTLTIYLAIENEDGEVGEETFIYTRRRQ